jgi:hypothetical protein
LSVPTLEDYRWLIGPDAAPWLAETAAASGELLTLASRLRKSLSTAQAHLVLEQGELRRRAKEKFAAAERMFFTPRGLEQATDEIVAAYKANRMPEGCVADLCCGMGGDLLGLARRGPVLAIDRDPITVCLAEANCRACGFAVADHPVARILTCDALAAPLDSCLAAHLDPDRRPAGRRTTQLQYHDPSLEQIEHLRQRMPNLALKLAPAAEPPPAWREQAEWEWISRSGQCRQLVAWFGSLAEGSGTHRATLLGADESPLRTLMGQPSVDLHACERIGRFVYEPDAAVLAAGLEGALAEQHGLTAISSGIAYLTGDAPIADPALAAFAIDEILPFDLKKLRSLLRQRGIGRLEIKKRGVSHDPAQLRRQLALRGSSEATLIVTRYEEATLALLCRRLAPCSISSLQGVGPVQPPG